MQQMLGRLAVLDVRARLIGDQTFGERQRLCLGVNRPRRAGTTGFQTIITSFITEPNNG